MGLVGAPMHFQSCIDTLLSRAPGLRAVGYLDDITAHGTSWEGVWKDTLTMLRVLTSAGFMVNLRKCKFLATRVTVLGVSFYNYQFQLGAKTLKKWVKVEVPTTLKELQ